jgi:hypothetical protein
MRQVLTIFRKDVRCHWPRLAGALMLTALIGIADVPAGYEFLVDLVNTVWACWWIYLAASLIQQERLPGDCQYWLTRPYDWRCLLAAKGLFVLVFAALPLVAVKGGVLWLYGVSPFRHASAVLTAPVLFTGTVALVAGALAAITETLAQFLWALLALVVAEGIAIASGPNYTGDWGVAGWIRTAAVCLVIAAAGGAVLLLQYRMRRTFLSRTILFGASVFIAAAPFGNAWHIAWRLEERLDSGAAPGEPSFAISFDPSPRPRLKYGDAPLGAVYGEEGLYLPIRISGIPASSAVVSQRVAMTVETGNGTRWSSGWRPTGALVVADPQADPRFLQSDGAAWQFLDMDRAVYQAIQDEPVRGRVSVALLLLTSAGTGTVHGSGTTAHLPLDGICDVRPLPLPPLSPAVRGASGLHNFAVLCSWPRPGPERVYLRSVSASGEEDSHALLADALSLVPTGQSLWRRESAVVSVRAADPIFQIETLHSAGYLERSFEIPDVRLKGYAAPCATDRQ